MDLPKFWRLIEDSKAESGGDTELQVEILEQKLTQLEPDEIIGFDKILLEHRFTAYRWDLWGAADVINGGCSDDCFEYFRGWLIAQGEAVFDSALQNPDSLADVVSSDMDEAECEDVNYVAMMAYEKKMGREMPDRDEPYPDIIGDKWTEADLPVLYPKLCAKIGCE